MNGHDCWRQRWPVCGRWRPCRAQAAREGRRCDPAQAGRSESGSSYGRDYAETHHSPLTQIDQSNVSRLGLAWSVEVGSDGKIETTPLVFNGVLYGTSTWSQVYAIDLRTEQDQVAVGPGAGARRLRRRWGRARAAGPVNRGVAMYDGSVYVGLLDGRLVALDAETGTPVWAVQTTPPGYAITRSPARRAS